MELYSLKELWWLRFFSWITTLMIILGCFTVLYNEIKGLQDKVEKQILKTNERINAYE